ADLPPVGRVRGAAQAQLLAARAVAQRMPPSLPRGTAAHGAEHAPGIGLSARALAGGGGTEPGRCHPGARVGAAGGYRPRRSVDLLRALCSACRRPSDFGAHRRQCARARLQPRTRGDGAVRPRTCRRGRFRSGSGRHPVPMKPAQLLVPALERVQTRIAAPAAHYRLPVATGLPRTLARTWLLLGLAAIALSGVFSILLVLAR